MKLYERPRDIDFSLLQSELLKALRGKKSRTQMNQDLALSHNLFHRWESGKHKMPWQDFLHMAKLCHVPLTQSFSFVWYKGDPANTADLVKTLLAERKISEISAEMKISSSSLERWLKGKTQPSLPDLFKLIHVCTDRFVDFISLMVPANQLRSLTNLHELLSFERDLQRQMPWVALIPRCVELENYEKLPKHKEGFLAKIIGITAEEERKAVAALVKVGVLSWKKDKLFVTSKYLNTDDPQRPWAVMEIFKYWLDRHAHQFGLESEYIQKQGVRSGSLQGTYRIFTANEKTLKEVKNLIYEFNQRLLSVMSSDINRNNHEHVLSFVLSMHDIAEKIKDRDQ